MYTYGNMYLINSYKFGGGVVPSIDPDAEAFLTAAAITDPTITSAIDTLVVQLKADGIWTKMKALYPFVGGTASTHKFNLKNPLDTNAAFRLVFNGGWTHSSTGIQGNGVNGYANTFFTPSVEYSVVDNAHFSMYSRLNQSQKDVDLGVLSGTYFALAIYRSDQGNRTFYNLNNTTAAIVIDNSSVGFYNGTISGTAQKGFKNGVIHASNTISAGPLPTSSVTISTINVNGIPNAGFYSNKEYAFASIGDGLSDTEAANFYTAVQAFQTTLSRQV